MSKEKRKAIYWANNTKMAIEIKESLLEKGLEVKHILSGSDVPVLKEGDNYTSGAGNIISIYELKF